MNPLASVSIFSPVPICIIKMNGLGPDLLQLSSSIENTSNDLLLLKLTCATSIYYELVSTLMYTFTYDSPRLGFSSYVNFLNPFSTRDHYSAATSSTSTVTYRQYSACPGLDISTDFEWTFGDHASVTDQLKEINYEPKISIAVLATPSEIRVGIESARTTISNVTPLKT